MENQVEKNAFDKLILRSQETIRQLAGALKTGNVRASKHYLSLAEMLRDGLESKLSPDNLKQGVELLEIKTRLDDAIVNASDKLGIMNVDVAYHSGSRSGLFGARVANAETDHPDDDIDFLANDF